MLLPTYRTLNSTNEPFTKCILCSVRRAQFKASFQTSVSYVLRCMMLKKIRKITIWNGTPTSKLIHEENMVWNRSFMDLKLLLRRRKNTDKKNISVPNIYNHDIIDECSLHHA